MSICFFQYVTGVVCNMHAKYRPCALPTHFYIIIFHAVPIDSKVWSIGTLMISPFLPPWALGRGEQKDHDYFLETYLAFAIGILTYSIARVLKIQRVVLSENSAQRGSI